MLVPSTIFEYVGLKQGAVVADLGCGATGLFTISAARLVGNMGQVYAVDVLKSVLEEVSKRSRLEGVNNVKTVWSNIEIFGATKIKKESLDLGMLVNVLFQSKEHENIMKEAARLLKKDARLLVIDWKPSYVPFGPPVIDRVSPDEVKAIAKKAGLSLVDEFKAGNFHFGLIFKK